MDDFTYYPEFTDPDHQEILDTAEQEPFDLDEEFGRID